ncbi:response regulator transcription factor [bacterium SCSIO 12741]|nr:response regulator transcription factor [bacterium SCSIO 12741]
MSRIILVDAHPFRSVPLLDHLKNKGIASEVQYYINPLEALKESAMQEVDLLLCDLHFKELKGWNLAFHAKRKNHALKCVAITASPFDLQVYLSNPELFNGYINKTISLEKFEERILRIVEMNTDEMEQSYRKLLHEFDQKVQHSKLTSSELEIIALLHQGKSTREIVIIRHSTRKTVESHIYNLTRKLAANGREDALTAAKELGLIF